MATKKKTAAPVEDNPFEEKSDPFDSILSDTDSPVVAGEPETPAPDQEPATGPDELTEPAKTAEPETTSKRRTKAQILADDIATARELLSENGYSVAEKDSSEESGPAEPDESPEEDVDFNGIVSEKTVITAMSGQITGTVDQNMVSVPILRLSQLGWVGQPPLEVPATNISDIRAVLNDLEKQAREFNSES